MSSVSIFGLGGMGTALASCFLKEKYKVAGCIALPNSSGWHQRERICLLDNAAVQATLDGALDHLQGKTIVNLPNETSDQARKLSNLIVSHGARYIHGGIMATPSMIGSPHALVLYSWSPEAFKATEADLLVLAKCVSLDEDAGFASLHDLSLLSGMYGLFLGFLHATMLVRSSTPAVKFMDL